MIALAIKNCAIVRSRVVKNRLSICLTRIVIGNVKMKLARPRCDTNENVILRVIFLTAVVGHRQEHTYERIEQFAIKKQGKIRYGSMSERCRPTLVGKIDSQNDF